MTESLSHLFFDNLDDTTGNETDLLQRAVNYHASIKVQQGDNPYEKQLDELKRLIETHIANPTVPVATA